MKTIRVSEPVELHGWPRSVARRFAMLALGVIVAVHSVAAAADCNDNDIDDAEEIASGAAGDCNGNGVPDACDLVARIDYTRADALATGARPQAIAYGDLDGDGLVDLVVTSLDSDDLTIHRNLGGRRFERGPSIPVGPVPLLLHVADIDDDQDLDILVFERETSTLSLFRGDGAGHVDDPVVVDGGDGIESIEVVDLDQDGFSDLLLTRADADELVAVWGSSSGEFGAAEVLAPVRRPGAARAVDFDGDGDLDILYASSGRLAIATATGPREYEGFESIHDSPLFELVDLDGDGPPDVVSFDGPEVRLGLNDGEGGLVDGEGFRLPTSPQTVTTGDVDGDGITDVIAADINAQSLSVLFVDGVGGVREIDHYTARSGGNLIAVDLDGDGAVDVASTSPYRDEVMISWGEGSGRLGASRTYFLPNRASIDDMASGDFDADGDVDLVLASLNGLELVVNVGGVPEWRLLSGLQNGADQVEVADLDGDLVADLVAMSDALGVSISLGDGEGGFSAPVEIYRTSDARKLQVADMDGDGSPDILVSDVTGGEIVILANDGEGSFVRSGGVSTTALQEPFVAGDLNEDGRADIVDAALGDLVVHLATDDGGFRRALVSEIGATIEALRLRDMDGDGLPDIVAATGASVRVFSNLGGGSFVESESRIVGDNNRGMELTDFDLDGDPDILVASLGSDDVALISSTEGSALAEVRFADSGLAPRVVIAADFDADGLPDAIVADGTSGGLTFILNRSTTASPDQNGNGVPDECERAFHRGDANADGQMTIADSVFIIAYLLRAGAEPSCRSAADTNGDGRVDIGDAIYGILFLFRDGLPPVAPGPPGEPCGLEPGGELSRPSLDCRAYDACGV